MYFCIFNAYHSLQSHMIFRNHINIKKHFWLLSMLKTVVLINILVKTETHFIFQDSEMNRKFKRTAFIWNTLYMSSLSFLINAFILKNMFSWSGVCVSDLEETERRHIELLSEVTLLNTCRTERCIFRERGDPRPEEADTNIWRQTERSAGIRWRMKRLAVLELIQTRTMPY